MQEENIALHWADILVIVGYFVAVIGVAIWSSCRNRGSVGGYFLAGRSMHWIPVGCSLFASNIGSGHFIGLAGSGAANGVAIAAFELNAIFILMLLGWLFVPVYHAAGVFTMPEYLRKRFGGQRIRVYLSVLALILYVFTKISADLFAGATFITQSADINLYVAVIMLLVVAGIFTVAGGLTAVIWTDFIQTVIMLAGALLLMILSFIKVGGYEAMVNKFFKAVSNTTIHSNTTCGIPPSYSMSTIRDVDTELPWTGLMFGLTISSVWYWCSDQVIVQRVLAAKNMNHAKLGCILAGYLKFTPLFLMVFPGMISRVIFPNSVGCADPEECKNWCGSEGGCTNIAYPKLVLNIMPVALRGLMIAVMMSALISSLTSIFNSSSTLFTMDIWRRFRKNASEIELMIVGRVVILILVGIGIAWIPVVQSASELFHYIQAITSFLAPPICAVYVLAIFWKRANEQGAFWGLMVGLLVGLIRFVWEYTYSVPPCGKEAEDLRPGIIKNVHYLHFGVILFIISVIATVSISLLTKPIDDIHLARLTFWDRHSQEERIDLSEIEREDHPAEKPKATDTEHEEHSVKWYVRAGEWICGIEKMVGREADERPPAAQSEVPSIYQSPMWKKICNGNALALLTAAVFVWGFYA